MTRSAATLLVVVLLLARVRAVPDSVGGTRIEVGTVGRALYVAARVPIARRSAAP